jgi:hypothetical protein
VTPSQAEASSAYPKVSRSPLKPTQEISTVTTPHTTNLAEILRSLRLPTDEMPSARPAPLAHPFRSLGSLHLPAQLADAAPIFGRLTLSLSDGYAADLIERQTDVFDVSGRLMARVTERTLQVRPTR